MNYLPTGETVFSDRYRKTLNNHIQQRLKRKWSGKVLLKQDNARSQHIHKSCGALTSLGFTMLYHLSIHPTWHSLTALCSTSSRMRCAVSNLHLKSSGRLPMSVIATPQETVYVKLSKRSQRNKEMAAMYTGCNRRNGPDFGRVFLR